MRTFCELYLCAKRAFADLLSKSERDAERSLAIDHDWCRPLRSTSLPKFFGKFSTTIQARSEVAFRRLIDRVISFYSEALLNPHWGEQIAFRPGNVLEIKMVFQGLDRQQAETIWQPFKGIATEPPSDRALKSFGLRH